MNSTDVKPKLKTISDIRKMIEYQMDRVLPSLYKSIDDEFRNRVKLQINAEICRYEVMNDANKIDMLYYTLPYAMPTMSKVYKIINEMKYLFKIFYVRSVDNSLISTSLRFNKRDRDNNCTSTSFSILNNLRQFIIMKIETNKNDNLVLLDEMDSYNQLIKLGASSLGKIDSEAYRAIYIDEYVYNWILKYNQGEATNVITRFYENAQISLNNIILPNELMRINNIPVYGINRKSLLSTYLPNMIFANNDEYGNFIMEVPENLFNIDLDCIDGEWICKTNLNINIRYDLGTGIPTASFHSSFDNKKIMYNNIIHGDIVSGGRFD